MKVTNRDYTPNANTVHKLFHECLTFHLTLRRIVFHSFSYRSSSFLSRTQITRKLRSIYFEILKSKENQSRRKKQFSTLCEID